MCVSYMNHLYEKTLSLARAVDMITDLEERLALLSFR